MYEEILSTFSSPIFFYICFCMAYSGISSISARTKQLRKDLMEEINELKQLIKKQT